MSLLLLIFFIVAIYYMGKSKMMLPAAVILGVVLIHLIPVIVPIAGILLLIFMGLWLAAKISVKATQ